MSNSENQTILKKSKSEESRALWVLNEIPLPLGGYGMAIALLDPTIWGSRYISYEQQDKTLVKYYLTTDEYGDPFMFVLEDKVTGEQLSWDVIEKFWFDKKWPGDYVEYLIPNELLIFPDLGEQADPPAYRGAWNGRDNG